MRVWWLELTREQRLAVIAAAVWMTVTLAADVVTGRQDITFSVLFAVPPLLASTAVGWRVTAAFAAVALGLTIASAGWDNSGYGNTALYTIRIVDVGVISAVAVTLAAARTRRERRLAEISAVAAIAQQAVLPSLPDRMGSVSLASRYRSATRAASVGGDVFDAVEVGGRMRVIIGDVRGKGLTGVGHAARTVRVFRLYAGSEPDLVGLAVRMSAALAPYLNDEDFVTAALVEIAADAVDVVGCGHPPPLLSSAGQLAQVQIADAPPLGVADRFGLQPEYRSCRTPWRAGDRLLLYTDGLIEARNRAGTFFPIEHIAAALTAPTLDDALDDLLARVDRHRGGGAADDLALLVLEHQGHVR